MICNKLIHLEFKKTKILVGDLLILKTNLRYGIFLVFRFKYFQCALTLVLLNPDISCFANSVDPDQLASEEAN